MINLSFTINPNRTETDFLDYETNLIATHLYQGCEIFYPINDLARRKYTKCCNSLLSYCSKSFHMVCHLPYGQDFNICRRNASQSIVPTLLDAITWANQFGIKNLTFHPGCAMHADGSVMDMEEAINNSIKNIQPLLRLCQLYNISLNIENLVGVYELCKTPEDMMMYLNRCNNAFLHVTFDVAHYHTCFGVDNKTKSIKRFIQTLGKDIYHVHISDNDQSTDQHHPIGSGTIDFPSFFHDMNEIGYKGLYSSEVLFKDSNDLIETEKKVRLLEKEGEKIE